ncbi:hypothetical protein Agub_g15282 [Astrephomene gubernaculifera]|uniref:DUF7794 domain-containing protein n=1 Tax=Astrephomene gubernaculifera TaxID=47775 RepID=A0AAD3HTN0_9CHLO|nr:hypothetical protein Agub_g15282 [Astrephomene gubernaculifera]
MIALLLPLFAACFAAAAASTPLVLVDSLQNAYVQPGTALSLDKSSVSALVAAATGLMPGSAIGADLSHELSQILKPSPLVKPRAFVALNVAGLTTDVLGELFANRQHRTVELTGNGCSAMAVINGLSSVAAANPSAKLVVVDQLGVQNCKDDCMKQLVAGAVEDCQMDMSSLDLTQQEEKLFSVELATVYSGIKAQLAAVQKRSELKVAQEEVEVYEVSLMGLRALINKYGQDSPEVSAAKAAVMQLLDWAVNSLDAAYAGDIMYQVLPLQKAPQQAETLSQLAGWKDRTRRQLLQASYPGTVDEETAAAKLFSAKAAGYGSFVLLLYFSAAAIWCMCNMPFKRDTLLYGSKKDQ